MDLNARPYRCFIAIVEKGTFNAAANALDISQPALSAQIRELERQLGFDLFVRTSRRVALTASGRRFLDYARRIVVETDWVNQAAREIRTNPLRIATAHFSAQIAERSGLIDDFLLSHPQIPVTVTNRSPAQIVADLSSRLADVAITMEPRLTGEVPHFADEDLTHLAKIILGTRQVSLLIPREHGLARHEELTADFLADQEICSLSRAHGVFLSEILARELSRLGARRARAPEGDQMGVIRYARLVGLPCFNLGWFPIDSGASDPGARRRVMVDRRTPFLNINIDLVVLADEQTLRPAAEKFWAQARKYAATFAR